MAKTIVQHDEDPGIVIILSSTYSADGDATTTGTCTQCGYELSGRGTFEDAEQEAVIHIDQHESAL